ncbi:spondin domain-containing protein [Bowmanella denitrificans]|uniref:spondin domain-containing protein n=1 Tax=Bowmanella denitrificans TaxID=366582 RepID=UPI000C9A18B4|nr:spondin domain-containing protein [Bowmanella denitrificans]
MNVLNNKPMLCLWVCAASLSGCFDGNDNNTAMTPMPQPEPEPLMVSYEVTVDNLTQGQPLSPITLILHSEGTLWEIGQPASVALEKVAESGDNADLLALDMAMASASGEGLTMPGNAQTITINIEDVTNAYLSVAAMLGKSNDAFTGLNAQGLAGLMVGESWTLFTNAYDAGTEANTENMASIGAAGGEGFSEVRDDARNMVTMHPGIVSMDDGLATSALTQEQRFDNPVARIRITRTQ